MKNYSEYWKNKMLSEGEENYGNFCREGTPDDECVFVFCCETGNSGPCCASTGVWHWSKDIDELASWIIEFQLRNIFACCDEGRDIKGTLDMSGVEYLKYIADKAAGMHGDSTRQAVYALAKEFNSMIYAGQLTFEKFSAWLKKLEKLSENMPVLLEYRPFATIDDAMELLCEHEVERGEGMEEVDDVNRFEVDIMC